MVPTHSNPLRPLLAGFLVAALVLFSLLSNAWIPGLYSETYALSVASATTDDSPTPSSTWTETSTSPTIASPTSETPTFTSSFTPTETRSYTPSLTSTPATDTPTYTPTPTSAPAVDLDVDTNRNGVVEDDVDEDGEDNWTKKRGAFFMVNLDDDDGDGKPDAIDFNHLGKPIRENPNIDNAADAQDITELIVRIKGIEKSEVKKVKLEVETLDQIRAIHLFPSIAPGVAKIWGGPPETKPQKDITQYVKIPGDTTFGIEGLFFRYLVADAYGGTFPPGYKGRLHLKLVIIDNSGKEVGTDEVELKVSPFIMLPNTQATEELWATDSSPAFVGGLAGVKTYAFSPQNDRWAQDHIEIGYTHAPGRPKTHIVFRLPRSFDDPATGRTEFDLPDWPLKELLKPDTGIFTFRNTLQHDGADSGDYGGNLELIPPTAKWPLGRIVTGDTISARLYKFLQDQEVQSPIQIDTSWLAIGHVDELVSFIPDGGGWSVVFADPEAAEPLVSGLPKRAVFFAKGQTSGAEGLKASGGRLRRLVDANIDFTIAKYAYAHFIRIFDGKGAGQVAHITAGGLKNGFIQINQVWKTPQKVAKLGPGGAGDLDCVSVCIDRSVVQKQDHWFDIPDNTSRYVLVEDTQVWFDGDNNPVPAIITVQEIKADTTLASLNSEARMRINAVKQAIATAVGEKVKFISVPDFFMGTVQAGGIVARSSVAFTPGLANVQVANGNLYFPESFGPRNSLNADVFDDAVKNKVPGAKSFVDDWVYHTLMGEVHCGTNVKRAVYDFNWWEKAP